MKAVRTLDLSLHSAPIYSIAADAQRLQFFTGGQDPYLVRWMEEAHKPSPAFIGTKLEGLGSTVYAIIQNHQTGCLFMGGARGVFTYQKKSGDPFNSRVIANSSIYCLGQIPDSQSLLAGTGQGELIELDHACALVSQHAYSAQAIRAISFHPHLPIFALAGKDSMIYIVDLATRKVLYRLTGHVLPIMSVAFSPSGQYLASGSRDATIRIWDCQAYQLRETIPAHFFAVNHILFHPTRPYFITASMDKTIKIWGAEDFNLYKILSKETSDGHTHSVNRLAWFAPARNGSGLSAQSLTDPIASGALGSSGSLDPLMLAPLKDPSLLSVSDDRRVLGWQIEF